LKKMQAAGLQVTLGTAFEKNAGRRPTGTEDWQVPTTSPPLFFKHKHCSAQQA
jgi:hypothetical protein